jgi:hypothetical protein
MPRLFEAKVHQSSQLPLKANLGLGPHTKMSREAPKA